MDAMNVGGKAVLEFDGKRVMIGPPEISSDPIEQMGGDKTNGTITGRSG
ncbi:hypothetical protein [Cohnella cholangitidis]